MKVSKSVFVAGLLLVALLIGTASMAAMKETQEAAWPKLQTSKVTEPTDEAAVRSVIERSYDVVGLASQTFDTSQFPSVFTNDRDTPLSEEQLDYLSKSEKRLGKSFTEHGWLSYKLAFFQEWQVGAESLEQAEQKALAENRTMTADELGALHGFSGSGSPPAPRGSAPTHKTTVSFSRITLDGTRAEVIYDDGAVTYLTALVKTPNGWRIAGERYLAYHV